MGTVFAPVPGAALVIGLGGTWEAGSGPPGPASPGLAPADRTRVCPSEGPGPEASTTTLDEPSSPGGLDGPVTDCAQTDPNSVVGPDLELSDGAYVNPDGGFNCQWHGTSPHRRAWAWVSSGYNPNITEEEARARKAEQGEKVVLRRALSGGGEVLVFREDPDPHGTENNLPYACASGGTKIGHLAVCVHPTNGPDSVTNEQLADAAAALHARLRPHY